MRGHSAGNLVRPTYPPDIDQPTYTYRPNRPDPVPYGYERTVDDRPVCIISLLAFIANTCTVVMCQALDLDVCFELFTSRMLYHATLQAFSLS